jgi:nucleoid-associated protein YgaU
MQQIERYGVIALVFLLVTIVAVSFWGDSKSPGFWSRLTGKSDGKKEQTEKPPTPMLVSDHVVDPNLPLTSTNPNLAPIANVPVAPLANGNAPSATDTPAIGSATTQPPPAANGAIAAGAPVPLGGAALVDATPPPAPSATQPASNEYIVQKGDSLARIAATKLGNENLWRDIQTANPGLDPKKLTVGQKIVLPSATKTAQAPAAKTVSEAPKVVKNNPPAAKPTPPKSTPQKSSGDYVVKKGDHLASIAQSTLGDSGRWKDIVAANPGLDPNKLSVGQKIHIPAGGAAVEKNTAIAAVAKDSSKPRVR